MRKSVTLLIITLLMFSLVACQSDEIKELKKSELPVRMDVKPLQSYGNQVNQRHQGDEAGNPFFTDGEWIYTTRDGHIIKLSANDSSEVIYNFEEEESYAADISVLGDWVYFIMGESSFEDFEMSYLCRVKKDEGSKMKLASRVESYILTEEEIYYQKYRGTETANSEEIMKSGAYVMSFDGKYERELLEKGRLLGIDNGWIYYVRDSLHRMRPDGTGKEKVLDVEAEHVNSPDFALIEDNQIYFVSDDEKDDGKSYLMKKTIGGEKTVLDISSNNELNDTSPLNKEGDWLYYGKGNKVYKINVNGKGEKQLVYHFKEKSVDGHPANVNGILLCNDGALLSAFEKRVYIRKNGTVIDLEHH